MKCTLTKAALGLLIFALPSSASAASKKPWKHQAYCDPGDISCMMSNGQFKATSSAKRKVVVHRGPDCGEADAQTARGLNVVSNLAGLAPVPGIGIIFSIAGGEAQAQAEKKQWNCFERNVKSQLASSIKGIEREAAMRVGQIERHYAEQVDQMQRVIMAMEAENNAKFAFIESRVAVANPPPASTMQIMKLGMCVSHPQICTISPEPKLISGPTPAERPKASAPAEPKSAPSSGGGNTSPGRPERAEGSLPNFAGKAAVHFASRVAAK